MLYEIDNIIFELLRSDYIFLFTNEPQSFANGHFEQKMLRQLWRSDWYV
jgi:hypothetical protein